MAFRAPAHFWKPEEERELVLLHDDGLGIEDIAVATGIPFGAVRARLEMLLRQRRIADGRPLHIRGVVPAERLADREARKAAADRRDITATFCGDPPPGFSALDKRRQSA
jgi:hypothetical protein